MFRILPAYSLVMVLMFGTLAWSGLNAGDQGPDFTGVGVDGETHSLETLSKDAAALVICFTCNHCPVAVAYEDRFIEFSDEYKDQAVRFVAINCNKAADLEEMKNRADLKGFNFPYVRDETAVSARAYSASVTPHLFVLDGDGNVAYQGAFDDDMNKPKTMFVKDAVDAVLAGEAPAVANTEPFGCTIQLK